MNHFKHAFCNMALTAAPGTEDHVDTLHVQRDTENDYVITRSFWRPTPEELAVLNADGCVVLTMLARQCPPVRLEVAEAM